MQWGDEEWEPVQIELPPTLLRDAMDAAAWRGEPLRALVARALVAEVRLLTIEAWTLRERSARFLSD